MGQDDRPFRFDWSFWKITVISLKDKAFPDNDCGLMIFTAFLIEINDIDDWWIDINNLELGRLVFFYMIDDLYQYSVHRN